ncbi:MAG: PDZ domain-containing protein [Pirellulales bacterium]|nr:PDZ domain-containing protein [Pirellulales bacterium]
MNARHSQILALVAATAIAAAPAPARAADLDELEQKAFQAAVDRVAPSVVQIQTIGGAERLGETLLGTGPTTGLVVDAQGFILTSSFAFLGRPESILVRLPDGRRRPARRVAEDASRRLVLLKVDADGPLAVPEMARRDQMRVGQWAIAVGRTFEGDRPNVSVGILSATNRIHGKAIQTDAAVSPNNYGGPLVDLHGRVLGIIAPLSPHESEPVAGVEWYDAGIGFAVPPDDFLKALPRLKAGEDLKPGLAGFSLAPGDANTAAPVLLACRPGTPAAEAGLKPGDRIVEIDGRPVDRIAEVTDGLGRHWAGDAVTLAVTRKDKRVTASLTLVAELPPLAYPFLGILPQRSPQDGSDSGAVVRHVLAGSPAAGAGIARGDRITRLDGKPVGDADALRRRMAQYAPGREIAVGLRRGQAEETLKITLGQLPDEPPAEELPAAASGESKPEGGPPTGKISVKAPELDRDAWAYVPANYRPDVPCGALVWLPPPGEADDEALLTRWKPLCDRAGMILLVPRPSNPARWLAAEEMAVLKLVDELANRYVLDRNCLAIGGREGGGTMAFRIAWAHRDLFRGVVVSSAAMTDAPPPGDPARRVAFYVAASSQPRDVARARRAVGLLRKGQYPVALRELGEAPRPFQPDELAELARWLDALDRV